jgi:hypothetical protein
MLIGNGVRLNSNPMRVMAGALANNDLMSGIMVNCGAKRNQSIIFGKLAAIPRGTQSPYSWLMARKSGDLSTYFEVSGTGNAAPSVALGINLLSSVVGGGDCSSSVLTGLAHILASIIGGGTLDPGNFLCPL